MDLKEIAQRIKEQIADMKGENVVVYDVQDITPLASYYVVGTGLNERNLLGIEDRVLEIAIDFGLKLHHVEGKNDSRWIIIDLNGIIVHLFTKEERERIDFDKLIKGRL